MTRVLAGLGLCLGLSLFACSNAEPGEVTAARTEGKETGKNAKGEQPNTASPDPEPFPAQAGDGSPEGAGDKLVPAVPADLEKSTDEAAGESRQRGNVGGRFDDSSVSSSTSSKKKRAKSPKAKSDVPAKPSARPGSGAAPPAAEPPREQSERAVADPDGLIANLDSLERQLRSAGLRLPHDSGGGDFAENQREGFDCEKVCEIRVAICALEERICSLAQAHPEDDRYANACERASGDCRVAKAACSTCD